MIKKLDADIIGIKIASGEQLDLVHYCMLKINEIIDHLPQEKEIISVCESCINYCIGEWTIKSSPCPHFLAKQPTKEVPDIRQKLREILLNSHKDEYRTVGCGVHCMTISVLDIDQAIKEISALYKRSNQ